MTAPLPMSREELLELAALDAFGLLDDYEAALFTRSFHHAPVPVQQEIKSLQADYAGEQAMLPSVEPDPAFRGRVLNAVAGAIEKESDKLAPLAMIGRPHRDPVARIDRLNLGWAGQFWRAAAFVLAAVLIVSLYFSNQREQRYDVGWEMFRNILAEEQIAEWLAREANEDIIGPDLMEFFVDPRATRVALRPASGRPGAPQASVLWRPGGEDALLFLHGFTPGKYTIVGRDKNGTEFAKDFTLQGAVGAIYLGELSQALVAALTWEVAEIGTGLVVITSA